MRVLQDFNVTGGHAAMLIKCNIMHSIRDSADCIVKSVKSGQPRIKPTILNDLECDAFK